MTRELYLRKNELFLLRIRKATKKTPGTRTWFRPKICDPGRWIIIEDWQATPAILEAELKEGKLTQIPEKVVEKNRLAWRKESEEEEVKLASEPKA